MKIKPEHYEYIKSAFSKTDKNELSLYIQKVKESGKFKDLERRILSDCLYSAVGSKWVWDNLYPYMDDTHIYTALKRISKELEII